MNRRHFLGTLGLALAGLYLRIAPRIELPPTTLLLEWFQTSRSLTCYSESYLRIVDTIMAGNPRGFLHAFEHRQQ